MTQPTLLIVDDTPENLAVLNALLERHYRVRAATSGRKALQIAATPPAPDLILLDVMMPDLDGYAVLERLRADPVTRDIPVIFVTALEDPEHQTRGLEEGAEDYIAKPIVPAILLARVKNQLAMKQVRDWLKDQNAVLEQEVNRRIAENQLVQTASIRALAHLAETRDPETGNHILRTQGYVNLLALRLRDQPRFAATLDDRYIDLLTLSAPLHDIGKVGIPDAILLKPGPLTPEERIVMETHTTLGRDAIALAEQDMAQPVPFLALAKEISAWHHEKWDGSGYPDGLAGEAIPVSARLMALADVFDALVSPRVYKQAIPMDQAREMIAAGSGTQFDPDVVAAFLEGFESFRTIAGRFADPIEPATPS
ncbi:MAG: two-component system response regulator [Pseudomonadota bacterium]